MKKGEIRRWAQRAGVLSDIAFSEGFNDASEHFHALKRYLLARAQGSQFQTDLFCAVRYRCNLSARLRSERRINTRQRKIILASREWRKVPEFPEILVSDTGAVMYKSGIQKKLMKDRGYYFAQVTDKFGTSKKIGVHILVAYAFLGDRPYKQVVRHLDGKGYNNKVSNLKYGTSHQNAQDRLRHTNGKYGNLLRKFTEDDIRHIRKSRWTNKELAAKFNVHTRTIFDIKYHRTYSWVDNRLSVHQQFFLQTIFANNIARSAAA